MTPVKGQNSSRHKGKEVAFDPPATHDEGEETVFFELSSFDEEEARHPPDSECAPLIDPWYNVHSHFPKVPGDYMPPPQHGGSLVYAVTTQRLLGHHWLLRFPISSFARALRSLCLFISSFGLGTALGWKEWVDRKLSDMGFMGLL